MPRPIWGSLQAKCDQTEQEWKRAKSSAAQKAIADTDYDLDEANYLVAKANVEVGKATIQQCEATLAMAKTNLDYTIIKSPVKGVIIDRRVNIGQTVVAAMSAPSLFLLAKDLRRMQVWASGQRGRHRPIHAGLPVHFTVDTYPGETFEGKVAQSPAQCPDDAERRHLHGRGRHRQSADAGHPTGSCFPT